MPERKITLGSNEYTLLPCPAIGLKAIGRNFSQIGTNSEAGIDALVDGLYFGVKRGIPGDKEFTREFVEWNVDATNLDELVSAFADVNSAARRGTDPGEAPAAS